MAKNGTRDITNELDDMQTKAKMLGEDMKSHAEEPAKIAKKATKPKRGTARQERT
jgi:hypothetical protein